jgi:hypothetical protein
MRDCIEVFVNVDLLKIPDEVEDTLRAICNRDPGYNYPDPNWRDLFDDGLGSFPQTRVSILELTARTRYTLLGKGAYIKNEDSVLAFFEWLNPWINADSGDFIGYMRHESHTPFLFFKI